MNKAWTDWPLVSKDPDLLQISEHFWTFFFFFFLTYKTAWAILIPSSSLIFRMVTGTEIMFLYAFSVFISTYFFVNNTLS